MKVVIVGGVAGGATAAARIRRLDEKARITVFEKTGYISYANCGLPYYIGEVITEEDQLTLQSPEKMWSRYRIEVKTGHEVTDVDADAKTVSVTNLETGETFTESYDKLILAPGAAPVIPDVSGLKGDKVFTLKNIEDTFGLYEYIEANEPKKALLIGAGYINLEIAENLRKRGMDVTITQRSAQVLNRKMDPDMVRYVHKNLLQNGVELKLGYQVTPDDVAAADLVVVAAGTKPRTELAQAAGLKLGNNGGIAVDDRMATSDPDIYAVGDAVETINIVTEQERLASLAGPANKQARVAADNICGIESHYRGSVGAAILEMFGMAAAMVGITEEMASGLGLDYDKVILSPLSHASYYPGAKPMPMKVIYEKNTLKILGAQIIGYEGVDKRIDVLSVAMQTGMKATDLKNLDLAYAPPFASAKDPVNMVGFMIEDIEKKLVAQYGMEELEQLPADGSVQLIDVRSKGEYERGHIEGFVNVPVDSIRDRLDELDKDKPVYLMCHSGLRSYIAARILTQEGYDCMHFAGGYSFYNI